MQGAADLFLAKACSALDIFCGEDSAWFLAEAPAQDGKDNPLKGLELAGLGAHIAGMLSNDVAQAMEGLCLFLGARGFFIFWPPAWRPALVFGGNISEFE